MQTSAVRSQHEAVESGRGALLDLCQEIDPEVDVNLKETVDVVLTWGGRERHIEVAADRLAALHEHAEVLRHEIDEAVQEMRRLGPALETLPGGTRVEHEVEVLEPTPRTREREALDSVVELARHIVDRIDPAARVSFEEYDWHGEPTLDIAVALHGHEQHLEIGASRALIILPDYEWELRNDRLEDELLYHELEEVVHDLHKAQGQPGAHP